MTLKLWSALHHNMTWTGTKSLTIWIQFVTLSLTPCVTSGNLYKLCVPCFPFVKGEEKKNFLFLVFACSESRPLAASVLHQKEWGPGLPVRGPGFTMEVILKRTNSVISEMLDPKAKLEQGNSGLVYTMLFF